MTLKVLDVSKFQGPAPDYSGYDAVILNCTPQNVDFEAQLAKAVAEGKLIGYYSWPFAFGPNGASDGAGCAATLAGEPSGPVFWDVESGSYGSADPVAEGLGFAHAIHSAGRGCGMYVQYSLINAYDWSPVVAEQAFLWFAEYTTAPDTAFGAWPFATGWQYADHADGRTDGGDSSTFYTDGDSWEKLSVAPGAAPAPAPTPVPAPAPQPAPAPAPAVSGEATVEAGDSLSSIAAQVGVSLDAIEAVNREIPNFDAISVGEVINLPAGANLAALHGSPAPAQTPTAPSHPSQCVVVAGDSLSGIGYQFGVDWHAIADLNGIVDPYIIYPGQVLNLPA